MIVVADNINVMNPVVARAMDALDESVISDLALRFEDAGAEMIDINPGPLSRRRLDRMPFLVDAVQGATQAGLVLDSPFAHILESGLDVCRDKPILSVNIHSLPLLRIMQTNVPFTGAGNGANPVDELPVSGQPKST